MHNPDLPFAHIFRILEREPQHSLRCSLCDQFYGLNYTVHDYVFDAAVFTFGVLADQDRVDVIIGGFVAGYAFARPDVGEEVERAAEG